MRIRFLQKLIDKIRAKKSAVIIPQIQKCGKHSYIHRDSEIINSDTEIGSFCSISENVKIGLTQHPLSFFSTSPFFYNDKIAIPGVDEPVIIGNDVWIGANVSIMGGVKIFDGAVIGTGAVVTKDVPPYAIVGGIPAKIIRYRFDEHIIEQFLQLKWWNFSDEMIKNIPFNVSIEESIEFMKKCKEYYEN